MKFQTDICKPLEKLSENLLEIFRRMPGNFEESFVKTLWKILNKFEKTRGSFKEMFVKLLKKF